MENENIYSVSYFNLFVYLFDKYDSQFIFSTLLRSHLGFIHNYLNICPVDSAIFSSFGMYIKNGVRKSGWLFRNRLSQKSKVLLKDCNPDAIIKEIASRLEKIYDDISTSLIYELDHDFASKIFKIFNELKNRKQYCSRFKEIETQLYKLCDDNVERDLGLIIKIYKNQLAAKNIENIVEVKIKYVCNGSYKMETIHAAVNDLKWLKSIGVIFISHEIL